MHHWTPILESADLPEGKAMRALLDEAELLLYRRGDRLFAVSNRCTHQRALLHKGIVKATGSLPTVTCPVHGSMFQLTDGRVIRGPAMSPIQAYDVRMQDEMIEVRPRPS